MIKNKFIVFAEKQVKFFPSSDKYKIIISLLALIYLLTASFSIYKYVRVKARYKTKISEYQSRLSEYQTQLSEYQKSINAWEAEFNRVYYKYKIVPNNLDIVELRSSVDEKFKYNSNLKKAKTWEELKGLLEKEFALLKPTLMQEWKITDEKLLLAGYITAKVTNLWDRKRFHSQQDRVSLN